MTTVFALLLCLLVGVVLGGALGALWARGRATYDDREVHALRAADQAVVDQLAAIPTKNEGTATALPASQLGTFTEIPLENYTGTNFPTDTAQTNYALVTGASIVKQTEALTYSIVTPPNAAVATAAVTNNRLNVTGVAAGTTTITIKATDKAGNSTQTTVTVTVA